MAGVTGPRRARSAEDKQQRRQDILDRAWELFRARPWAELTMSDVAEAAGLSKAALYRYFETKEALFLEVEAARLGEWLRRRSEPSSTDCRGRRAPRWWGCSSATPSWPVPGSRACSGSST